MSEGRASQKPLEPSLSRALSEARSGNHGDWREALIYSLPMPLVIVDRKSKILECNAAWAMLASQVGETPFGIGALYHDFLREVDRKGIAPTHGLREHLTALKKGEVHQFEQDQSLVLDPRRHLKVTGMALSGPADGRFLLLHEDRSQLHRTEEELREGHSLFLHVINQSRDAIFLYDIANRLVLANEIFTNALGVKLSEVIGKNIFELFDPEMARLIQEQNILVISSGHELSFEMMFENLPVIVRKGVYRNHRNEVAGVYCIGYKGAQENIQDAQKRSEQHFRALIESNANRVALIDRSGVISYASPSSHRMVGFTLEEQVGSNSFLWIHPQDLTEFMRRFNELLEKPGGMITSEYRTLCKDGRWVWMEATHTNLLADPNVKAIVVNERDITERKEAEMELTRFAQIIHSSSEAIFSSDLEGHILSWNPAAASIFGYNRKEILGKESFTLIPEAQLKTYRTHRKETLKGRGADGLEMEMLRKDGSLIHALVTLSPIRGREGQIIGVAKVIRDMTERRRLEKQILEISDREKQRLGQDLHDDLCQHLIGIGMASSFLNQQLERAQHPQSQEAARIARLADQAIDHARRLARGLCPLHLSGSGFTHGLELLVENTAQLFRSPCRFICPEPIAIDDESQAIHLYRITQEALHNAVKHSQASEIEVRLLKSKNELEIVVSDNGIGMREPSHRRRDDPSGLGMHTMRYRAQIVGADLSFTSNPGGGTCFRCRMPLGAVNGSPASES